MMMAEVLNEIEGRMEGQLLKTVMFADDQDVVVDIEFGLHILMNSIVKTVYVI